MTMPLCNSEKLGLYANSKKIKKASRTQFKEYSSPESDDVITKKYKTYTKSQKTAFVEDLKKILKPYFEGKSYSTSDLIDHLESLNRLEYNEIIETILAIHAPFSLKNKINKEKWQKELKHWRRQLKAWLKSDARPDKRECLRVISTANIDEFKKRITTILKSMPARSFKLLRSQAINVLEEIHNNENPEQPFSRNTFSKHFWYDFKRAHPDIDELYESLPISKNCEKKGSRAKPTSSGAANNDEFEEEFSISFSGLSGEFGTLSPSYGVLGSELDSLNEETPSYCLDSSSIEQDLAIEKKKGKMTSELTVLHLTMRNEEETAPKYDFYKERKTIVETEENEFQKNLFRCFYFGPGI